MLKNTTRKIIARYKRPDMAKGLGSINRSQVAATLRGKRAKHGAKKARYNHVWSK